MELTFKMWRISEDQLSGTMFLQYGVSKKQWMCDFCDSRAIHGLDMMFDSKFVVTLKILGDPCFERIFFTQRYLHKAMDL